MKFKYVVHSAEHNIFTFENDLPTIYNIKQHKKLLDFLCIILENCDSSILIGIIVEILIYYNVSVIQILGKTFFKLQIFFRIITCLMHMNSFTNEQSDI